MNRQTEMKNSKIKSYYFPHGKEIIMLEGNYDTKGSAWGKRDGDKAKCPFFGVR
jgi:hypothetical protein